MMSRVLIGVVMVYRATLARFLGGHCRFHPSCSQYAIDAVKKHGPWRGGVKAAYRVCRCNPLGGKGYDPA